MSDSSRNSRHLDRSPWRTEWSIPEGVTYLNHGSFGPSPRSVLEDSLRWSERLEAQPMQFFVRDLEELLDDALRDLGKFVGAPAKDLIFVDNATFGMNIVAESVDLQPGDEVLLTDHEYGAVLRVWRRKCRRSGAKMVTAALPDPLTSPQAIVESVFDAVTEKTRLIVVSHVTSPTAVILPVAEICREARSRDVAVCIDGPHAVGMLPLSLRALDCEFYAASCHKWLSAPFGSGFLYVSPRRQGSVQPPVISWGGSVAGRQPSWKDEFQWLGTRDPAAFLAVPAAITALKQFGLEMFRERGHTLAREFRERMTALTGMESPVAEAEEWFGTMATAALPAGEGEPPTGSQRDPLQDALWERFQIEIPVVHWKNRRMLRASCHLYNDRADLDRLMDALERLLKGGGI